MLDGWLLIVTGPKLIDELRRSPDDELSSTEGTTQVNLLPRLVLSRDRLGTHRLPYLISKTSFLASIAPHRTARTCTLRYALQVLQLRHTLGPGVDDQFHVAVVRDKLTRNLAALFPDVLDEVQAAFAEYVPAKEDGTSFHFVFPELCVLLLLSHAPPPSNTRGARGACESCASEDR